MARLRSGQEPKRKGISALIENCRKEIADVREHKNRELRSTVLTYEASSLHYKLERVMSVLGKSPEKYLGGLAESLPLSTLETVLPDLLVAAVLWFEGDALLDEIDQILGCLGCLINGSKRKPKKKIEKDVNAVKLRLEELLDKTKRPPLQESESNLLRNHDFLSQQIDERSSQFFNMGALFVPVSFLIFASAVTTTAGRFLEGVPLMFASLTCYLTWFIMYLRNGKLNRYSYPVIHSLELILGLSTHSALGEIAKKNRLVRMRQQPAFLVLCVLVTLWILFWINFTDVWLTIISLIPPFVGSLLWGPSRDRKYAVVLSFMLAAWALLLVSHFFPSFLTLFSVQLLPPWVPLLVWWAICYLFWWAVWFVIVKVALALV